MPVGELLAVEGFDEDIVEELRARARDALLNEALAVEEEVDEHQPAEDLLALEGMDDETAFALAGHGIRTVDDLGELAPTRSPSSASRAWTRARAAALILAARAEEIARLERRAEPARQARPRETTMNVDFRAAQRPAPQDTRPECRSKPRSASWPNW